MIWQSWRTGVHVLEIDTDGFLGSQVESWTGPARPPLAATGWGDGHLVVAWTGSIGLMAQRFASRESTGLLRLTQDRMATREGDGPMHVRVERREGNQGAVTAHYRLRAKSAEPGQDFLPAYGTVTFADGEAGSKDLVVPVLDDTLVESEETLVLELSQPTGGALLGSPARTRIEIRDDDVPSPLLSNASPVGQTIFVDWYDVVRSQGTSLAGGGFLVVWLVPDRFGDPPGLERRLFDREGREITRSFPIGEGADSVFLAAQPGGGFTVAATLGPLRDPAKKPDFAKTSIERGWP